MQFSTRFKPPNTLFHPLDAPKSPKSCTSEKNNLPIFEIFQTNNLPVFEIFQGNNQSKFEIFQRYNSTDAKRTHISTMLDYSQNPQSDIQKNP